MRAAAFRYPVAVITTAVALVLTALLPELLAPMRLFFLWCAVLISALVGGTRAGLLSAAISLAGAVYFVVASGENFALTAYDYIRVALFGMFAGGISIAVGQTKLLADRLRDNERRYRTLVESTPLAQAVWTATPDGTINAAPDWLEHIHPDDAVSTKRRWQEAVANETLYEDEIRIRVADGRDRWFAIKGSPVRRRGERIVEWAGIVTDIHDRKRHESNAAFINRASELLSTTLGSEQTLRNLARLCVPALVDWCIIDLGDGPGYIRDIVEHADPARAELALKLDARDRPSPHSDPVVQVLRSGRTQFVDDVPDKLFVRELGLRSWIVAPMIARGRTLGALTVAQSKDSGRLHSVEDIPLIEELARRAAMALDNARLYEAADEANRAKDEFLATLSHELRTPLTAISGWAHMLHTGITDPDTRRLAVETIIRSAHTQGELIDDLLDLSRVVAGTLRLQVEPIDLVRIVHEVMVAARPAADAKNVTLALASSATPLIVRGDQRRLRQIAWNLLTNAVKFTNSGGSVHVNVSGAGAMARIEVKDTGRGIDASFLPYVWERFRQADSSTSRQFGGLGLGLAVVRHLVEMHGGLVHAESDGAGRGAMFRIDIPLARSVEAQAEVPRELVDDVTRMRGLRVLLLEDDSDARAMMTTMLTQFGATVTAARTVSEALWLLDEHSYDVAVSDIAMPGEDGYAFVEKTRSRLPAVAVSAIATGADDRRRALDAGFADFVRKPVDPQELVVAVLGALGGRASSPA